MTKKVIREDIGSGRELRLYDDRLWIVIRHLKRGYWIAVIPSVARTRSASIGKFRQIWWPSDWLAWAKWKQGVRDGELACVPLDLAAAFRGGRYL